MNTVLRRIAVSIIAFTILVASSIPAVSAFDWRPWWPGLATPTLRVSIGDEITGATVNPGDTGVEMLEIVLTAIRKDIEVDELMFHRNGVGSAADLMVYLYDDSGTALTCARSISPSTNNVYLSSLNLVVPAGDSVTLTLVADFSSSAYSRNEHFFELVDRNSIDSTAALVFGFFPIAGEIFTVN